MKPVSGVLSFAWLFLCPLLAEAACDADFLARVDQGALESPLLTEASGLAASRRNPGVWWTHNDSGDEARLFAIDTHGRHLGVYHLSGATNRDWEDIAVGPGPVDGVTYLYVGEIGDNNAVYDTKYVYRVPEPLVDPAQSPVDTTLTGVQTIALQYPNGRRDAETLMCDPLTRDLYVVSKREAAVFVFCAPYPQSVDAVITMTPVITLPLTSIVAGDISPSGQGILLKDYARVYHWCREPGETVAAAFGATPDTLPYVLEPQGEAVAWAADEQAYFTTSEEDSGIEAHLYAYPRVPASSVPASPEEEDQGALEAPAALTAPRPPASASTAAPARPDRPRSAPA